MSKYREYVIAQPERFVKLPDGTFVPVMRPLIADADAVLRSQVTIGCVDGREGIPTRSWWGPARSSARTVAHDGNRATLSISNRCADDKPAVRRVI